MRALNGGGGCIEFPGWDIGVLGNLLDHPYPMVGKTNTNCPLNFSHELSSGIKYMFKVLAVLAKASQQNPAEFAELLAKTEFDFVLVFLNLE